MVYQYSPIWQRGEGQRKDQGFGRKQLDTITRVGSKEVMASLKRLEHRGMANPHTIGENHILKLWAEDFNLRLASADMHLWVKLPNSALNHWSMDAQVGSGRDYGSYYMQIPHYASREDLDVRLVGRDDVTKELPKTIKAWIQRVNHGAKKQVYEWIPEYQIYACKQAIYGTNGPSVVPGLFLVTPRSSYHGCSSRLHYHTTKSRAKRLVVTQNLW
ncbi:hypothetical protein HAX54_025510 [Datura stramonium]|uniref:Uncharacterized protein n=1 Tax=Datura stramonium TaxID=4076 RepID=A0ABS8UZX8_DATST|nr:hypothetical protein [Datura stramonium]